MKIKVQEVPGGHKTLYEVAGKTQQGFIVRTHYPSKEKYAVVPFHKVVEEIHEKPTLMGPS